MCFFTYRNIWLNVTYKKLQLHAVSDSSLPSSATSLIFSNSPDSFSSFDKLEPYDLDSTGSGTEDTDGKVSSSTIEKENIDWCLCVKNARPCLPILIVCAALGKMKSHEIFYSNFLHF